MHEQDRVPDEQIIRRGRDVHPQRTMLSIPQIRILLRDCRACDGVVVDEVGGEVDGAGGCAGVR